jgi:hypothetical protein
VGLVQGELPHGDTPTGTEIEGVLALDGPARSDELAVDLDTGLCFPLEVAVFLRPILRRHNRSE